MGLTHKSPTQYPIHVLQLTSEARPLLIHSLQLCVSKYKLRQANTRFRGHDSIVRGVFHARTFITPTDLLSLF